MSRHVVLLGDSIFDNARYVPGEKCVSEQVRDELSGIAGVQLEAVDGDMINDVISPLRFVCDDATHMVVSVGGNDALKSGAILAETTNKVMDGLAKLAEVVDHFERDYNTMLDALLARKLPTIICTIYDHVPGLRAPQRVAVRAFNDVITREASCRRLALIDLRVICTEPGDYSDVSPIEPSSQGGFKIARAIARSVRRN